uniref:Uncharacterized protein n=1 Tax=viral metagenome TaxID=1070528 RepID=A0A6H1ZKF7_9ZZZZ
MNYIKFREILEKMPQKYHTKLWYWYIDECHKDFKNSFLEYHETIGKIKAMGAGLGGKKMDFEKIKNDAIGFAELSLSSKYPPEMLKYIPLNLKLKSLSDYEM